LKTNQKAIDLIKSFEGLSFKPYPCPANIPTIGYGSTFYEDGRKVSLKDDLITVKRAEDLLKHQLGTFEAQVTSLLKIAVNENQFGALVSFTYNLGAGAFGKSTLLKLINEGKPTEAADEFLKWTKAGGKELPGLVKRRNAERDLFVLGTKLAEQLPAGPTKDEINSKLAIIEEEAKV
jgi:lysozyme